VAVSEPGDGAFEDTHRDVGILVGADLDMGDTGVVVDDRVQERGADVGCLFSGQSSALRGGHVFLLPCWAPT
jgi:hypothetical protein